MVLDIDSFLDEFEQKNSDKYKNTNLDFQKDVEDKIYDIEQNSQDKDNIFLEELYKLISKFDQDLPNKFFGISQSTNSFLLSLGERYSKEFLEKNIRNEKIIEQQIESIKNELIKAVETSEFHKITILTRKMKLISSKIPNLLTFNKIGIAKRLYQIENSFYQQLNSIKEKYISNFKSDLHKRLVLLKQSLDKADLNSIESNIASIKIFLTTIPESFVFDLDIYLLKTNKVLEHSQQFLESYYKKELDLRKATIIKLKSTYHYFKLKKDIQKCLLLYNQILNEFNRIPDLFLEEKQSMYIEINNLFADMNKQFFSHNIDMFFDAYKNSKALQDKREYLYHLQLSKSSKKKINNYDADLNIQEDIIQENNYNERIDGFNKDNSYKYNDFLFSINEISSKLDISVGEEKNSKRSSNNYVKEIDLYYQRLKKSMSEQEILKLYEKIIFYLNLSGIKREQKISTNKKIKTLIESKKWN